MVPKGLNAFRTFCMQLRAPVSFFSPLGRPQNGVFSLMIAHITLSLCFCTKEIFFGWSQRDSMHLGPLCMQLRAPISFFRLFGANSSPEKVQHS